MIYIKTGAIEGYSRAEQNRGGLEIFYSNGQKAQLTAALFAVQGAAAITYTLCHFM